MSLTFTVLELANNSPGTVDVLAQTTDVNTNNLRSWISDNIIFTILIGIACVVLLGGAQGKLSRVFTVGGLSLVGLAYLGIAQSENAANGIGNWILGLFGISV
jgi:hypothetical protein